MKKDNNKKKRTEAHTGHWHAMTAIPHPLSFMFTAQLKVEFNPELSSHKSCQIFFEIVVNGPTSFALLPAGRK